MEDTDEEESRFNLDHLHSFSIKRSEKSLRDDSPCSSVHSNMTSKSRKSFKVVEKVQPKRKI